MGNYNPDAPIILGEEWVAIRDENLALSPATNSFEVGHGFSLATARTLQDGRFYVNDIPPAADRGQVMGISVYPAGTEALSGPVKSVVIPCNAAAVTGGTVSPVTMTSVEALLSPATGSISFTATSASTMGVRCGFAVSQYPQLNGKRILGVNLLTAITGTDTLVGDAVPVDTGGATSLTMTTEFIAVPATNYMFFGRLASSPTNQVIRTPLGEINPFWTTNAPITSADRMHWTYSELLRFDTTTPWLFMTLATGTSVNAGAPAGSSMFVLYVALEVFYCEEQRAAFGALQLGGAATSLGKRTTWGTNVIPMRTMAYASNPALAAGDYTVTVSSPNVGRSDGSFAASSNYPLLNAERELYQLSTHPGVQVNLPFPLDDTAVDRVFTQETTHVLPQISLHTSGGPLIEMHVYGRQVAAQVYGTITATQDIEDSVAGASFSYPWVRYYARRFGDTTVPLTLTGVASLSGSSTSITVDEFDALPEIIDGWKQVTLRFDTPPSMGTVAGYPAWTWSATGEVAGNRWEVLGACAPALSGIAGSLFNLVQYPNQLGPGTYGAGANQAITFISAGVAAHGNNASVVPGMPAGIQRGDLLLIHAAIRNSPTGNPDAPTGYTQLMSSSNMRLFGKIYDGTETAPTVNFSDGVANATTSAQMAAFRNVTLTVVSSANQLNGSAANIATPAIAAGVMVDDTLVLYLGWRAQDWTSVATIAGATEIGEPSSGLGDNQGIVWDYVIRGAAAAVNADSFVVTGGVNGISRGAVVALLHAQPGSEVELTWMPQGVGSNYVTTPSADPTSDAVLLFSQDSPAVSGFVVSVLSQAVSGIGQSCGLNPCGIPSAIYYNQLSWTPDTSAPVLTFVYEIQRSDTVDTDWQTIMLGNPTVSGFNDYEARVGIESSYRIREVNAYGFYGAWSSTVSATVTDPGLVAGCVGDGHVLIFTSNSRQNGSANLGYLSVWENGSPVDEGFTFPEAGWVQLQSMYNKDFYTAFRPLERGGDRFQRNVLVQAAAISPETLADFTGLRDLAWDSVPYVCVRDEDGNRWFATIVVPGAHVRLNRSIYMATVDIIEVTDTPTAVSP